METLESVRTSRDDCYATLAVCISGGPAAGGYFDFPSTSPYVAQKDHIIHILSVYKYSSTHQSLIPVLDVAANQPSCIRIHKLHYNTEIHKLHGIPDTVNFTSEIS